MESLECDVVIIGAGLSGLSAAYYLTEKDRGLRIAVVEAKDRIGGRTLTRQLTAADDTKDFWDLGGEWVGRPQPHMHFLLHKFNINTFNPVSPNDESEKTKVPVLSLQTRIDLLQFTWKLKKLQKQLAGLELKNCRLSLDLDNITFEDYREEHLWTKGAKEVVDAACKCMFGLAPSEMSMLYFLMYVKAAGGLQIFIQPSEFTGRECRVNGGVQQLASLLVQEIEKKCVFLCQPVTNVVQSIDGVHVITSGHMEFHCQRVIMAIPPHHAAAVSYQPPLPHVKLGLLQSVPLAFLVKFAITYKEAFWKQDNSKLYYGFQAVLENAEFGPVGIVYDATSGRGNPALAGFVSSSHCFDIDPKNRRAIIMRLIENILGPECHKVLEFSQLDWSKESYNGGCFLRSLMPGTTKYFNSELRDPFDRVHFAGTESATVWCGFMNGAVQAGFRAATEVLSHIRPLIVASPDPDTPCLTEDKSWSLPTNHSWVTWAAVGMGFASAVYFLSKSNRISPPATFVKNIHLVFDTNRLG